MKCQSVKGARDMIRMAREQVTFLSPFLGERDSSEVSSLCKQKYI